MQSTKWWEGMDEKNKAILNNNTWELATLPERQKTIGVKWMYKAKKKAKGEVERHKGRLVAKGCNRRLFVDKKSTIALAKNHVFHDQSKHIDTRYHFIRETIARKKMELKYVKTQDQVADIFTKPLKHKVFFSLIDALGLTRSSLRESVEK